MVPNVLGCVRPPLKDPNISFKAEAEFVGVQISELMSQRPNDCSILWQLSASWWRFGWFCDVTVAMSTLGIVGRKVWNDFLQDARWQVAILGKKIRGKNDSICQQNFVFSRRKLHFCKGAVKHFYSSLVITKNPTTLCHYCNALRMYFVQNVLHYHLSSCVKCWVLKDTLCLVEAGQSYHVNLKNFKTLLSKLKCCITVDVLFLIFLNICHWFKLLESFEFNLFSILVHREVIKKPSQVLLNYKRRDQAFA